MKKVLLLFIALVTVFILTACNGETVEEEKVIYVTVYPMEFLIQEIAGDTVTVKRVPGSNSHSDSIDWSAKEIIDMISADLLFYLHAGVDDYVPNNEDSVFVDGDVELINMSQYIEYNMVCYQHQHEEVDGTEEEVCDESNMLADAHFWLDPVRMMETASFIKDKLIATYPEHQEIFNNNYTYLDAALRQLHTDYEAMAQEAVKPIITTVMLFTYWHERYDIDILPITNDAHSSESDPGDIIELINTAIEHQLEYILFEKNTNSPAGDQLLDDLLQYDVTATSLYLHGLGTITTDEMDNYANYITIMYDNLEILIAATK